MVACRAIALKSIRTGLRARALGLGVKPERTAHQSGDDPAIALRGMAPGIRGSAKYLVIRRKGLMICLAPMDLARCALPALALVPAGWCQKKTHLAALFYSLFRVS